VHDGVECCNILPEENAVILFHPSSQNYWEGEKTDNLPPV
jgi:hypothetical protein